MSNTESRWIINAMLKFFTALDNGVVRWSVYLLIILLTYAAFELSDIPFDSRRGQFLFFTPFALMMNVYYKPLRQELIRCLYAISRTGKGYLKLILRLIGVALFDAFWIIATMGHLD